MATRKDYVAAAEAIREAREAGNRCRVQGLDGTAAAIVTLTEQMADYFGQDNPRFDRKRFMQACRPENVEAKAR